MTEQNEYPKEAMWLPLQDTDFIAEYTYDKVILMDKAITVWNSLTVQLCKAGQIQKMTARELLR